ncbi:hypothetical protein TWF506_004708 [Arthrobotrys conoides]|uniref:Uncharacterized protein n=1 Tax=Arthrobotrys conoides TaxID=74498 RepID=A0AAN8NF83_9PEZI
MVGSHDSTSTQAPTVVASASSAQSSFGMTSPPPAYITGNSRPRPPCSHLDNFEIEDPPFPSFKMVKTYITLTTNDIRILTALTGVHYLFKLWWIICILIGVFTPQRLPISSISTRKPKAQSPVLKSGMTLDFDVGRGNNGSGSGIGDGAHNTNKTGMNRFKKIGLRGGETGGDNNIALKMAVAAIVFTFIMSLVKICILQRIKAKGKYNTGMDGRRGTRGGGDNERESNETGRKGGVQKEKYVLGVWWEKYVNLGHWVGVVDEVLGLILTVCLMQGRESMKTLVMAQVARINSGAGISARG